MPLSLSRHHITEKQQGSNITTATVRAVLLKLAQREAMAKKMHIKFGLTQ